MHKIVYYHYGRLFIVLLLFSILLYDGCVSEMPSKFTSEEELARYLHVAGINRACIGKGKNSGGVCTVDFSESGLSDLTVLKGLPINSMVLSGSKIVDLRPLIGMPLIALSLVNTGVTDLSPLKEMPLKSLEIKGGVVEDISPLKGMPLISLQLSNTKVRSVSPLRGMPLKTLFLNDTVVTDLSPLKGMQLDYFTFTPSYVTNGLNIIREMKTLRGIGDPSMESPDRFWKRTQKSVEGTGIDE